MKLDDTSKKLGIDLNQIQRSLETPVGTFSNARSHRDRDSKPLTRVVTPYNRGNNSSEVHIMNTDSSLENLSKRSSTKQTAFESFEYWPSI